VFRFNSLITWFFIFLGSIVLGSICYLLVLTSSPNLLNLTPLKVTNRPEPIVVKSIQNTNNHNNEPTLHYEPGKKLFLKNPFVVPLQYNGRLSHHFVPRRPQAFLKYQGIIETDSGILGLVKVTTTDEAFVVHEGECIIEFGLEIRKITPETLTYFKDGKEAVISLGGI
jgi:hypothetical protein